MLFFDLDGTLLDFKSAEYAGVLAFRTDLIACERTGTSPREMIYVGDDPVADITPCAALRATGIWINRRSQTPVVPVQRTIGSLNELFGHLPQPPDPA